MGLNRFKIATKLWVFIGIVLGLLVGIAAVGLARSAGLRCRGSAQQLVALVYGASCYALEWI